MNKEFSEKKKQIDQALIQLSKEAFAQTHPFFEPFQYTLTAPGKRIRGVLTLVFCERLKVPVKQAMPFALALEMIHSYSLVHDDMPEMDNDDFRRGMPTCHKKFGAGTALLVGDGILNFSMEYLLQQRNQYDPQSFLNALDVIYRAAGMCGMLLGQMLDKNGEQHQLSYDELLELHRCKTGALLEAPILIAGALSGSHQPNFEEYCRHIGLAFQIKDDLLDVEGDQALLGKSIGKDFAENKSTFITILGIESAKAALQQELAAAKIAAGEDDFLCWLADYIGERQK